MVAVGLLACVVAALASTGKGEGEAANLEWVQSKEVPDSKPVAVPGGKGEMQLTETRIRATGTNVSGYSLFIASSQADDLRRRADRRRPHRLRGARRRKGPKSPRAPAACAAPTRAPPKTGSTTRKCRKRC